MNPASQSAEKIEFLLLDLLAPMRGNDDTLLHFEIDSHAIAKSVWENFVTSLTPSEARQWKDWAMIESALSDLVQQTLALQTVSEQSGRKTSTDQSPSPALWLEQLICIMRDIDHRTLEILALRIEGYDDRDISEQLKTGLRCIKRIFQEMRLAWEQKELTRG